MATELRPFLNEIADAIREKKGTTDPINAQDFADEIKSIESGGGFNALQYLIDNYEGPNQPKTSYLFGSFKGQSSDLQQVLDSLDLSSITSASYMFQSCSNLTSLNIRIPNATNLNTMCSYCSSLTHLYITCASEIDDISYMMQGSYAIKEIHFTNPTTAKNADVRYAFNSCNQMEILENLSLENPTNMNYFLTSANLLTDLSGMHISQTSHVYAQNAFQYMRRLTKGPTFENNTFKVRGDNNFARRLFEGCEVLESVPILDCGNTANTSLYFAFRDCRKITYSKIINAGGLTNLNSTYWSAQSLETVDIDGITAENLTDCTNTFKECFVLTKVIFRNITGVPSLTDAPFSSDGMFYQASQFSSESGTGLIYVPDDLVDSFKTATNWSELADHIVPISTLVE